MTKDLRVRARAKGGLSRHTSLGSLSQQNFSLSRQSWLTPVSRLEFLVSRQSFGQLRLLVSQHDFGVATVVMCCGLVLCRDSGALGEAEACHDKVFSLSRQGWLVWCHNREFYVLTGPKGCGRLGSWR